MDNRQKIVPHLWFDHQAREAAEFYVATFGGDSRIQATITLSDTPGGDTESVYFELAGHAFQAISGGPAFTLNPSVSFLLNFDPSRDPDARAHLDALWARLAEGGTPLMPLDAYPHSERYGWIQDRYGVSWQLMLTDPEGDPRPFITPMLLFVGGAYGKAEEAMQFYQAVFDDARQGLVVRFPAGMEPDREGTIMYADFQLLDQWFAAMDSAHEHDFTFNEAISLMVQCEDQAEIDRYWKQLSAVPEAEQCGWVKDRFGVSWQILPAALDEMLLQGTPEQVARVTQAFLPMKKIDLAALRRAYAGGS